MMKPIKTHGKREPTLEPTNYSFSRKDLEPLIKKDATDPRDILRNMLIEFGGCNDEPERVELTKLLDAYLQKHKIYFLTHPDDRVRSWTSQIIKDLRLHPEDR